MVATVEACGRAGGVGVEEVCWVLAGTMRPKALVYQTRRAPLNALASRLNALRRFGARPRHHPLLSNLAEGGLRDGGSLKPARDVELAENHAHASLPLRKTHCGDDPGLLAAGPGTAVAAAAEKGQQH